MNDNPEDLKEAINRYEPGVIGAEDVVETAVLIPVASSDSQHDSGLKVFFERRAEDLDIQPGDVCFPGGFRDTNDETTEDTALRETAEELGVKRNSIELWGQFDSMLVPWELEINTYVGWLKDPEAIRPDSTEVKTVFSVELREILEQEPEEHEVEMLPAPGEGFPYEKIPGGRDYDWRPRRLPELFYEFDGHVVWGITARILREFTEMVKESHDVPG